MTEIVMFAGPSLHGTGVVPEEHPGVQWLPPARRGDIDRLVDDRPRGAIALADGTFHSYPSVGHAEIRRALEAGWRIYGLCSMGAIRACEMAHLGMLPWGRVAGMFVEDQDLADDEVALVHGAEAPYMPLSEPLLHIREFLHQMAGSGLLTEEVARAVAARMQQRWYAERTLHRLRDELKQELKAELPPGIEGGLKHFQRFRLKQQDLVAFLNDRPWITQ